MKTFEQWCEDNNYEIPVLGSESAKKTTKENRIRTGYDANYPDAYVAAQYPSKYFNPSKSTADLDAENMKKRKK